jgi:hypothetical protein
MRLIAYVVAHEERTQPSQLREHLAATLPAYMVPSAFVLLDALPLTPNGKLDRKALPRPDTTELQRAYEAPRTDAERMLAAIWSELLGVSQVGRNDNFFALGGHSLLAMRVVARIRKALHVELTVGVMYESSTLEELARTIDTHRNTSPSLETFAAMLDEVAAATTGEAKLARATVAQEYFWYLRCGDPDPSAYGMQFGTMFEGTLDREVLASCVCAAVAQQSIYRTRLFEREGRLHQIVVDDAPPVFLDDRDGGELPEHAWPAWIDGAFAELLVGLDLVPGKAIRARLAALAPDRHVLLFVIHHGAGDGAAYAALLRDILARYEQQVTSSEVSSSRASRVQFIDFAATLERFQRSQEGQRRRDAWRAYLSGAPAVEVPVDHGRAAQDVLRDRAPLGITPDRMTAPYFDLRLPASTRELAQSIALDEGASPYLVYLCGLAYMLREHSGQQDITIQTSYDPRAEHPSLEHMQGPASSWRAVRVKLDGCGSLRELVRSNVHSFREVNELGMFPDFYDVVPHTARRVVFNYLPGAPRRHGSAARFTTKPVVRGFPVWKRPWDLHLTMADSRDSTRVVWTGNERLFRRDTIKRLLDQYVEILGRAR